MATSPDSAQNDAATVRSRWALVISDDGVGANEALRELAASYWYCVYAWWRRSGGDAAQAAAATLASFTRWLTTEPPRPTDCGAALMRDWLPLRLAEIEAQGLEPVSEPAIAIDPAWAEERYADEPAGGVAVIFHRRWALTMLEFTATNLRAEYAARNEDELFAEMLPFAGFEAGDEDRYSAAASRVGRSSGAMRKAVFDFRTRQREVLRAYVGDTVADPADIENELTALLCACDTAEAQMTALPGADQFVAPPAPPLPTAIQSLRPGEIFARAMQSVRMTGGGADGWQPPSIEEAARLFPGYEVLRMLGRGGMGAVYQARQIELDRLVAIKLLPLEISVDKDFADRFRREARAMAKLNHPHIITVFDFGQTREGHLFFAMEFVEGANLHAVIHHGGLEAGQALSIAEQICAALAYAHGKGVVHRDIKPANVMIDTDGQVKVADFGLARLTDTGAGDLGHTMTGAVMGTPDYMAPEQMKGMNVDHRADIYSLGVMLYEMLCREVPKGIFDPPSHRTGCDSRIDQIVIKAMHQAPDRRYQSTQEMKTDVVAARTPLPKPEPIELPPPPTPQAAPQPAKKGRALHYAGLAAVLAAVTGGAIFLAMHTRKSAAPRQSSAPTVAREPGAVRLWNSPAALATTGFACKVTWDDGALRHDGGGSLIANWIVSRDGILRAAIRANPDARVPQVGARFRMVNGKSHFYRLSLDAVNNQLELRAIVQSMDRKVAIWKLPRAHRPDEWVNIEWQIAGVMHTLKADGQLLGSVDDAAVPDAGSVSVFAGGNGYFRDIVYVPLDQPASRPSVPAKKVSISPSLPTFPSSTPDTATKDAPFVNTLGMKFVPVPISGGPTGGQRMLFSVWETRVQDYEVFANETKREWRKPSDFDLGPTHPAVSVSWDDATEFCAWLTERERRAGKLGASELYRLPTDHEWSCAVGLGDREDPAKTPEEKSQKIQNVFPWGEAWPPPAGAGNFSGEEVTGSAKANNQHILAGYRDDFPYTSPVDSFAPNQFGLCDMAGNVFQWCEDQFRPGQAGRVMRSSSYRAGDRASLASSVRNSNLPSIRGGTIGFRCVLGVSAPAGTSAHRQPDPTKSNASDSATARVPAPDPGSL